MGGVITREREASGLLGSLLNHPEGAGSDSPCREEDGPGHHLPVSCAVAGAVGNERAGRRSQSAARGCSWPRVIADGNRLLRGPGTVAAAQYHVPRVPHHHIHLY